MPKDDKIVAPMGDTSSKCCAVPYPAYGPNKNYYCRAVKDRAGASATLEFRKVKELGEGSFGTVHLCEITDKVTRVREKVAVKHPMGTSEGLDKRCVQKLKTKPNQDFGIFCIFFQC
jgi:hypothetical protein